MAKRGKVADQEGPEAATSATVDPRAILDLISRAPVFCGLPSEGHEFLAANARASLYPRGALIGGEGMTQGFMFGLLKGRLRGVKVSPEGRRLILMYMEPGDWAGFYWLMDDSAAVMDCEAIEKSICVKVERNALAEAGRRWPRLYEGLYVELVRRTRRLFGLLELGVARSLEVRMAIVLLRLLDAHRKQTSQGVQLDLPVSQTELAGMAFCSRQHVNRVLGQWSTRGIVKLVGPKSIIIRDVAALEAEAYKTER